MLSPTETRTGQIPPDYLVFGSGGSRTILAGAGAQHAFEFAGIPRSHWKRIGGISGGYLVAVLYASGMPSLEVIKIAAELEFQSLLDREDHWLPPALAVVMSDLFWSVWPEKGSLSTKKLGAFIKGLVPEWPEQLWTIAASLEGTILFDKNGALLLENSGAQKIISCQPAPIDIVVRGTCTVPGLMTPPQFQERLLFDGVLSKYGSCPVALIKDLFGSCNSIGLEAQEKRIFGDVCKRLFAALTKHPNYLWKRILVEKPEEALTIEPDLGLLPGLDFSLSETDKWFAIMEGYIATLRMLAMKKMVAYERTTDVAEQILTHSSLSGSKERVASYARSLLLS